MNFWEGAVTKFFEGAMIADGTFLVVVIVELISYDSIT